jgi:hypothetical protein
MQDISAKSPVPQIDSRTLRLSLDSNSQRLPRPSFGDRHPDRSLPTAEEGFEDVGLNDDIKPKKRGLFSRFGDSSETGGANAATTNSSSGHGFHIIGRKRGHSGHGAELRNMDRKTAAVEVVKVDK